MIFQYSDGQDGSESGNESAASVKSGLGSDAGSIQPFLAPSNSFNTLNPFAGSSDEKATTKADKDLTLFEILERLDHGFSTIFFL